jgi:hypothetical protein
MNAADHPRPHDGRDRAPRGHLPADWLEPNWRMVPESLVERAEQSSRRGAAGLLTNDSLNTKLLFGSQSAFPSGRDPIPRLVQVVVDPGPRSRNIRHVPEAFVRLQGCLEGRTSGGDGS